MRIIFMGTPEFAVGALEALIGAGHELLCVVTQPDKPKGRGKEIQFPPVKACALSHGIPVFQPRRIRDQEAVERLSGYRADIFVVAAFGQILSSEILRLPKYGCVNIHASLLPKYRGAAPIQWAIINGERESGVTIMQMNEGLDTGDMLARETVPITARDTGDSLHDKLEAAGAELIVRTLPLIERGEIRPEAQRDEDSCYAARLSKSLGRIDWTKPARELERLVRGLNSWPGCYSEFHGKTLKIWETAILEDDREERETAAPGTIVRVAKEAIGVQTGEGVLDLTGVQPEGKKRMATRDYLLGYPVRAGERLGE